MIKLYHAPQTRSVRIIWLLEELEVPYELETVALGEGGAAPAAIVGPRTRLDGPVVDAIGFGPGGILIATITSQTHYYVRAFRRASAESGQWLETSTVELEGAATRLFIGPEAAP